MLNGFCSRHGLLLQPYRCSCTCYCVTCGGVEKCPLLQANDTAVIKNWMHECIFGKQFFIVVLCGFIDIPAAKSKCSTFWSKKKSSITEQSCHRNNIKYMNAVAHKHPHIKIHDCY